jgi:hypothetical protein
MMNLQIAKVENGFIISVSCDTITPPGWGKQDARFVFNSWEAAAGFISSLNDKFK